MISGGGWGGCVSRLPCSVAKSIWAAKGGAGPGAREQWTAVCSVAPAERMGEQGKEPETRSQCRAAEPGRQREGLGERSGSLML